MLEECVFKMTFYEFIFTTAIIFTEHYAMIINISIVMYQSLGRVLSIKVSHSKLEH